MKSWAVIHDGEVEQLDVEIRDLPSSLDSAIYYVWWFDKLFICTLSSLKVR